MEIVFKTDRIPDVDEVIRVYSESGIKRPTHDKERIAQMYAHSNLVVTAWDGDKLVGISRSLTDFCYCCYLSDLAVDKRYQKMGIGKKMITITKEKIGDKTMLLLLAAEPAMTYYPKVGFEPVLNGYIIKRTK